MKNEVELYNSMMDYLPPSMDAIRIENKCIPGCFDVYIRHKNGNHLWLENKIANFKEKVSFEPSQYIFMLEHVHKFNGRCTALVGSKGLTKEFYVINLSNISKKDMYNIQKIHFTVEDYENLSQDNEQTVFSKHQDMKSAVKEIGLNCTSSLMTKATD